MEVIRRWFSLPQQPKDLNGAESEQGYRQRWITIRVVYLSGFLMFLSFGVMTTSLWPYLEDMDGTAGKHFLSVLFAAPPAGQLLFSPLIGWCSNRLSSVRIPFVLLMAIYVFANGLYSVVELFAAPHRKYVLLIARFAFGVATSVNTLSRAYISAATHLHERTKTIAMSSLAQTLGLVVGPIIQSLVSFMGKEGYLLYSLRINMYTTSGWICALGGVMYLMLLSPSTFIDRAVEPNESQESITSETAEKATKRRPLKLFPILLVLLGYGVLMLFYVSFQTTLSPLSLDQFGWSHEESLYYLGILLTAGTVFSCVIFLLLPQLCERYSEHNVFLLFAMFPLFLSQALMVPIGNDSVPMQHPANGTGSAVLHGCAQEWCNTVPAIGRFQLTISYAMLSVSFSVGIAISQTILSKLLGSRPQGQWMALYTSIGGLTRIIGPGAALIYIKYGTYWLFGSGAVATGLLVAWMWLHKNDLSTAQKTESSGGELQELKGAN
ncbi:major facilitator superfamily domain-containing protein 8-like [Anopheles cruzii]|uniref:major facilitator superfamily domain-containing protein 8-like n=1 Tax=Anopheles cruzii TaxID=68878 RepID=UPI0022EC5236|nr:major facilitator superfamily domain-containing protein 8-like [Anopheles cruzii]